MLKTGLNEMSSLRLHYKPTVSQTVESLALRFTCRRFYTCPRIVNGKIPA